MQKITSPKIVIQLRSIWFPLSMRRNSRRLASSSSNDDENKTAIAENSEKSEKPKSSKSHQSAEQSAASAKLADLLQTIIKEDFALKADSIKISTAKSKKGAFKHIKSAAAYQLGKEMADAISDVTKSFDGDKDRMQADLVDKVAEMKKPSVEHFIDSSVPGKEPAVPSEPINLSELLAGMTVDKSQPKPDFEPMSRSARVRQILNKKSPDGGKMPSYIRNRPQFSHLRDGAVTTAGLMNAVPLGIFKDVTSIPPSDPLLPVWEKMHQRELRLAVTRPPENIFEEMILWTNQGKLWKFPVNNEQGMEDEENVPFSEHVFLEKHLQGWCPKKGPIRHFMELVCVGLSKNPHYSVEHKKAHIQGYREYFESKKDLLKELGAV